MLWPSKDKCTINFRQRFEASVATINKLHKEIGVLERDNAMLASQLAIAQQNLQTSSQTINSLSAERGKYLKKLKRLMNK